MMSILPLLIVGVVAIIMAAGLHHMINPAVNRAKFVFGTVVTVGVTLGSYPLLWVLFNQDPPTQLRPMFLVGAALIVTAVVYAVAHTVCLKDEAPSR